MRKRVKGWTWRALWQVGVAAFLLLWLAAPSHAQYKIGPEDVLRITVVGNKDLDLDVTVQPDGRIFHPLAGELQAAGKTVPQLSEDLTQKMRTVIRDAVVSVSPKEVNSYKLFLVGAVRSPGTYRVRSEVTLLQLLSLAGGASEGADLAQAFILRKNERILVNAKKLLDEGDPSQNPILLPDDSVVIPRVSGGPAVAGPGGAPSTGTAAGAEPQVVYVMGEVRRPGSVPLTKDLNVMKALALAGGFTPFAAPRRVVVIRQEDEKKVTLPVDVTALLKGEEAKDVPLKAGDVVHVPESLF